METDQNFTVTIKVQKTCCCLTLLQHFRQSCQIYRLCTHYMSMHLSYSTVNPGRNHSWQNTCKGANNHVSN